MIYETFKTIAWLALAITMIYWIFVIKTNLLPRRKLKFNYLKMIDSFRETHWPPEIVRFETSRKNFSRSGKNVKITLRNDSGDIVQCYHYDPKGNKFL